MHVFPLVEPLEPAPEPSDLFRRLASLPYCLFLDSATRHRELGRYSFLAADPFDVVEVPADGGDGLTRLARKLEACSTPTHPGLPPFQGGAGGVFGYDLAASLEALPRPAWDEFRIPAVVAGLYDVVIAFDHAVGKAWLISQGLPETEHEPRRRRAQSRLKQFRARIAAAAELPRRGPTRPLPRTALCPQHVVDEATRLTSNFTAKDYQATVARAVEYIHAGDVFQVNLAQRLLCPARDDAVSLYLRLRDRNPAPFAGYFDPGPFQIASASPERFVRVRGRDVETRPIKGTRPRRARPEADLFAADDLLQSDKDRAENVMIVDLLRNDLSKVCEPDSVQVTQLCELEVYEYVQHLVSAIRGRLAASATPLDLLRAAFPGGSITGAPKVRAMEIISELEPTARGAYCGSLGYVGFDGAMDLSILIRTITAASSWWQMPVGGGIVAMSDPQQEYLETWHKAQGMLHAIAGS